MVYMDMENLFSDEIRSETAFFWFLPAVTLHFPGRMEHFTGA